MRTDPPVSVPMAPQAMPPATEAAAPDEDPPAIRSSSGRHGLSGVP